MQSHNQQKPDPHWLPPQPSDSNLYLSIPTSSFSRFSLFSTHTLKHLVCLSVSPKIHLKKSKRKGRDFVNCMNLYGFILVGNKGMNDRLMERQVSKGIPSLFICGISMAPWQTTDLCGYSSSTPYNTHIYIPVLYLYIVRLSPMNMSWHMRSRWYILSVVCFLILDIDQESVLSHIENLTRSFTPMITQQLVMPFLGSFIYIIQFDFRFLYSIFRFLILELYTPIFELFFFVSIWFSTKMIWLYRFSYFYFHNYLN